MALMAAIKRTFVLYVVSNTILGLEVLKSHEVDAIQTVKHKVWHGNDSNRVKLVELFPTATHHGTSTSKL